MLHTLIVVALCVLSAPLALAGPAETVKATSPKAAGTPTGAALCDCPYAPVPFYYLFHPSRVDRIYTTNYTELTALEQAGYQRQPDTGRVLTAAASGTIPLYRLRNETLSDHVYTIAMTERDTLSRQGWVYEGIAAHVLPGPACGTLPLYRSFNVEYNAHFYTIDPVYLVDNVRLYNFVFESVAGYIWPVE